MKPFRLLIFSLVMLLGGSAMAQSSTSPGNYVVVVGAFSQPANATKFSRLVKQQKLKPFLEVNKEKNLQYIYVMETNSHDEAIAEAKRLQESGPFKDAWVFSRGLIVEPPPVEEKKEEVKVEPVVIEPPKEVPPPVDSAKLKEEILKKKVDNSKMATKKGEMEKLDYIFFYKDASVLRPESRFAVDKLVRIMKQNPTQKIKIHGHTNGNDPGKIIRRASEKSDFFSLDNTVEDYGSAKELSEQRATSIRDYLIANGIDKKRMSVKAWGGKKPLYKVDDDKAEANVRVEIEVIKE